MASIKTEAPARARGGVRRASLIVVMLALGAVLMRGMLATGSLLTETQAVAQPIATAVLPTPPPTQHQLTAAEYAKDILANLSLNDKIAQMIMMQIDNPTLTDNQLTMLSYHVGGILFYGLAMVSSPQLTALTDDLSAHAYLPLFIATDQEGGVVNRLYPIVGDRPSELQIGQSGSTAQALAAGQQTAADFAPFGLNMDLAPVIDTQIPGADNATRVFSSDPTVVASMADAELIGIQQSGKVVGVIKHFPGLGAASTDPHLGLPIVYKTEAQLNADEFVPYRMLLKTGNVRAIMVTHELLPLIDPNLPSSLSPTIITGILRHDLGFQGLIVTDDLKRMDAISQFGDIAHRALLAAEAGADILMGPATPNDVQETIDVIAGAVQSGQMPESMINAAVTRILTLKIELGMIPLPKQGSGTPTPTPSVTPIATPGKSH